MKAQVEPISPVKTRLLVEVAPEDVAREEQRAYQELRRNVSVPGFRKGKVPLDVLKRRFGERVRSDVISQLVRESYIQALQEQEIVPVNDADIELQSASATGGISYTAVVEVRPTVEPRGYRDLHLKKARVEVEDAEVDARLEALRRERTTYEPAPDDHAAGDGDMIVMDYRGTIDGEPFEGGSGEDRSVVLGSGKLVDGFEEGLRGVRAGQERTVTVAFPEDYHAEALAGREAQFQVNVKEVKAPELPDLDDDFAQEVAGVDSAEELRTRVREGLLAEKQRGAERQFREMAIDTLLTANPFEVPDSLVRSQQAQSLERLRRDRSQRGMDPEALGLDRPEVQESHRRGAERGVRWAFLLQAIAREEEIEVGDEDVEERIQAIAEADGRSADLIRSFFDEQDRIDSLKSTLLENKVIRWVADAGTVEEVAPEELESGERAER